MAGINRLGKAPPRPGSLRPPDPNRNRVMNMYSEGAENDADYQRMVQDIEDAQQSQVGWLFGRGAFDKADLLYLRDEEEKRRFKEEELKDRERLAFRKQRATAGDPLGGPASSLLPISSKRQPEMSQSKLLAGLLKVKGSGQGPGQARSAPVGAKEPDPLGPPAAKRQKSEGQSGGDMPPAVSKAGAVSNNNVDKGGRHDEEDHPQADLAGMLGGYGSDSEAEEDAGPLDDKQPAGGRLVSPADQVADAAPKRKDKL